MVFRVKSTGQFPDGVFYKKSLVNPSVPIVTYEPRTRGITRFSVTPRRKIRYDSMNAFQVHEFSSHSVPARTSAWRLNSHNSDPQDLSNVQHLWGVDSPWYTPDAGFTYEPYGYPDSGSVSDRAMARLFGKVNRNNDTGLDAALAIAEVGQAWSLFATTAARVNRSYRELRRGNFRAAMNALDVTVTGVQDRWSRRNKRSTFRDDYLSWQYGVTPLLNDVDALCHKLADLTISKPALLRVSGRSAESELLPLVQVRPHIDGVQRSVFRRTYRELRVQHTLWYTVSNELVQHAASLGFTNPMSLVWQTLPTSFVFDWMCNVGGWLKGFSTFHGLQFHSGCTSRSGHETTTVTYGPFSQRQSGVWEEPAGVFNTYTSLSLDSTSATTTTKTGGFRRDVWASFPNFPTPKFHLPRGRSDDNGPVTRLLDKYDIPHGEGVDTLTSKFLSSLALMHQRRSLVRDGQSAPPGYVKRRNEQDLTWDPETRQSRTYSQAPVSRLAPGQKAPPGAFPDLP